MNALPTKEITLVVVNPAMLQHGSAPRCRFDSAGGTIGCRGANWMLTDQHARIQPIHCEIMPIDGVFCVVDRSGQTRINGSNMAIGQNGSVQLSEGDVLHIGPYEVSVHLLAMEEHALPDPSRHLGQYDVGELFNSPATPWDEAASPVLTSSEATSTSTEIDPLLALDYGAQGSTEVDPLKALEAAEAHNRNTIHATESLLDNTHYGLSDAPVRPDLAATRFEAVTDRPKTYREDSMSMRADQPSSLQHWSSGANGERSPLMQGLNAHLDISSEQDAYQLQLEAGQALQAALIGIAAMYGTPTAKEGPQLSMLRRTLQPIEDNPLRLGLDYADLIKAMFGAQRSLVHLSPKAAIDESLAQARQHNSAVVKAINESLEALLRAFSPDVLLQRFDRYRSSQSTHLAAGDWAWQMYTHYYNELASARQQGFEKLFWEIFEQAYDRALREEMP